MKLYKYTYTGTSARQVMGRIVRRPGDVIYLPIKYFRREKFLPEEISLFTIQQLRNKGKNKTLLLIGGGDSCKNFDYKSIKYDDVMVVNINKTNIKPDYLVYLEDAYVIYQTTHPIDDKIVLIGNELVLCNRTDYFYSRKDVVEGHGCGFYALQIADKIMEYKKIILAGYDFYGDSRDWNKLIPDYALVKWGNVININPDSKINKYLKKEKTNVKNK